MSVRTWLAERFRAKSLGERGEDVGRRYLKRQGYRILARHVDSPLGELDIIAVDGRTVVFVEVKTRSSTDAGHPAEAIDERKAAADDAGRAGLSQSRKACCNTAARFDVVAITWPADARRPTIEHYENAFARRRLRPVFQLTLWPCAGAALAPPPR